MAQESIKCRYCTSARVVKAGFDYQERGAKQRYYCKDCRRFTLNPARQLELVRRAE